MMKKNLFPMFVDLSASHAIVVGAGTIARRRIHALSAYAGRITVIAPEVSPDLLQLEKEGKISILKKAYEREDLYGADLVIAASGKAAVNDDIAAACKCLGIPVNVCTDSSKGDFVFPSLLRQGQVSIGYTSGGRDPKASRKVGEILRKALPGFLDR